MSGLYIHIPYCSQKCIYCDFFSVSTRKSKKEYLQALVKEMQNRKNYLSNPIRTLYFGGGTPTNLDFDEMILVFDSLKSSFDLTKCEEITMEANPEHLNTDYLNFLRIKGVNRLSIGIQSFKDSDLKTLCRRHDSQQAIKAFQDARKAGFENISIDLMFNLPNQTSRAWEENLKKAMELSPEHISCYSLTIEEGTILDKLVKKGKLSLPDEDEMLRQFDLTMQVLKQEGYEHYEVSNYCKPNMHSRHNTSYWQGEEYLGLGASAHSFNQKTRSWNPANIASYIELIENNTEPETEQLDLKDRYNEYVMLALRTAEGIEREHIAKHFPQFLNHYDKQLRKVSDLLPQRWHLVNQIAVELML
ncbi:MAG: radical SAM family heme chaperone HemW [Bacteroidales bacterium]|nr:radical SAM family heme chaperone HemW [Bacteroidales bacterium]